MNTKILLRYIEILFIIIFIASKLNFSRTYFVDATNGNNNNSGLTPSSAWKNINKVNHILFSANDTISFRRGDRFSGYTLVPHSSNLTFNAYGIGPKPVIDGQRLRSCVMINNKSNIKFKYMRFVNGTMRNVDLNGNKNITIEYCNIDSCAGVGIYNQNIYSGQGSYLKIRYSTISYAGVATGGGHGIYIDGTDNTLIEFDTLISNVNNNIRIGYGYTFPWFTDNLIVRYCIIKYAGDENISDDGSTNSQFYYNVFENDIKGWAVNISLFEQGRGYPSNNKYFNNTMIIHDLNNSDNAAFFVQASTKITKMQVYNNIFFLTNPGKGWAFYFHTPNGTWSINNNDYYVIGGSQNHVWHWNNIVLSSLRNWQSFNFDLNGIFADPLFNNLAIGDYSLKSNSPAINKGINVGLKKDIRGNSIILNPDIGAFEYHLKDN